ncbi:MAG TPA: tetratricopeptide repeat protein, partial [Candidatus Methylomirabilis sp.]|nr:tetratricopeptide repeat protein [Candidatus Methylomirabilis sp.]
MGGPREEFLELTSQAREALQADDAAAAIEKYSHALGASFSVISEDLRILARLGLADAFRVKGELAAAAQLTERALSDALRSYGERSAVHAEALNDAGVQKHYEGDLAAARDYYERAIEVFSQVDAPVGWHAACLVNLGTLLSRHFQEFTRATELFERAVEILGHDPDTAHDRYEVMEKLALHYHELSYHEERTISLLREVLEYKCAAYGTDAIATADTLALLGRCFEQAGDYASALSSLIDARRIYAVKLPVTDVRYANACRYLGSVRSRLDNFASAEALFREADSAYRATLGEFHPYTLDTRLSLAHTLGAQGRTAEEAALYDAVVDGYKQQYGERSRDFAHALHERGTRRMETGDLDGAAEDLARARKLRAEILGTGAYDYAITLN